MSEAEAFEALIELSNVVATQIALWLSITFAFLLAAHFVGKALSQFQSLVVSTLYVFISVIYTAAIVMNASAWVLLREREYTIFDDVWISKNVVGWEGGLSFFLIAGTLSSLYFMYSVRRAKIV